jgi:hypothetical protein
LSVDKPSGSQEQHWSNKEDIVNAFARSKFHYDLLSLLTVDDVQKKVQYHSACITNYLLKWKKDHRADNYSTIKNESEHDIAFKKFLDILHHDLFENKCI